MKFLRVYAAFLFILLSMTIICLCEESSVPTEEDEDFYSTTTTDTNEEEGNSTSAEEPEPTENDDPSGPSGGDKGGGSNENTNQGGGSSGGGGGGGNEAEDELEPDEFEAGIDSDDMDSHKRHRNFPKCHCLQKFRTSYLTGNVCGRAALCYWELWNYKYMKHASEGPEALELYRNTDGRCHKYMVEKYTCLIGYPPPRFHNEACAHGLEKCNGMLADILYHDCEPLREAYGLLKPQEVDWRINTEELNYDMTQDKDTIFRSRPSPQHPKWNNYYVISCPVIYRYPYFTIDILLKDLDPNSKYNELSALKGVAELIPRYAREGMNKERIMNFDALSLDDEDIHWCGITRNYLCVKNERDKSGKLCSEKRLEKRRIICEKSDQEDHDEEEHEETDDSTEEVKKDSTSAEPPTKETEKPKAKKG